MNPFGRQGNERVRLLPVRRLQSHPHRPRSAEDERLMECLAASMDRHGLLQPVIVRPIHGSSDFQVICGHRRIRAARLLKWDSIPAFVRDVDDRDLAEFALAENVLQEPLPEADRDRAARRLLRDHPTDFDPGRVDELFGLHVEDAPAAAPGAAEPAASSDGAAAATGPSEPEPTEDVTLPDDAHPVLLEAVAQDVVDPARALLLTDVRDQDVLVDLLKRAYREDLHADALADLVEEHTGTRPARPTGRSGGAPPDQPTEEPGAESPPEPEPPAEEPDSPAEEPTAESPPEPESPTEEPSTESSAEPESPPEEPSTEVPTEPEPRQEAEQQPEAEPQHEDESQPEAEPRTPPASDDDPRASLFAAAGAPEDDAPDAGPATPAAQVAAESAAHPAHLPPVEPADTDSKAGAADLSPETASPWARRVEEEPADDEPPAADAPTDADPGPDAGDDADADPADENDGPALNPWTARRGDTVGHAGDDADESTDADTGGDDDAHGDAAATDTAGVLPTMGADAGDLLDRVEDAVNAPLALEDMDFLQRLVDGRLQLDDVVATAEGMLRHFQDNPRGFLNLAYREDARRWLHRHAWNTAKLSLFLGINLGIDDTRLIELTCGALLADTGMAALPVTLVEKAGPLTDDERRQVREHPKTGATLIGQLRGVDPVVARVAREHHERLDGSGYYQGLDGGDLHRYTRIVMVADAYEGMTGLRPWREPRLPALALQEVVHEAYFKRFDKQIVRTLVEGLSAYPLHSHVRLATGEIARVVGVNRDNVERPVVRVVRGPDGGEPADDGPINLLDHPSREVVAPVPAPDADEPAPA